MMDDRVRLNEALRVFQEYGAQRSIPVRERWAQLYPQATAADMDRWEQYCGALEEFAYTLAQQQLRGEVGGDTVRLRIRERFPELSEDRVGHAYRQALYFASK